ncbi:hypothetical protein G7046_g8996 [Stylonectria norvegica]|nr:hypothetical protein G7046_g8996 [Stylonectria norvegica]
MHWLLASILPFSISSRPAMSVIKGEEIQVISSQNINGWVLCDMLDSNFQGHFRVEMDDDIYRIWAPRKLMQTELDRCRLCH